LSFVPAIPHSNKVEACEDQHLTYNASKLPYGTHIQETCPFQRDQGKTE
jgi:hypothetical protein